MDNEQEMQWVCKYILICDEDKHFNHCKPHNYNRLCNDDIGCSKKDCECVPVLKDKEITEIIQVVEDFFGMPKTMFEEEYSDFRFNKQRGWGLSTIDYLKAKYGGKK